MTLEPARATKWALMIGALVGATTLGVGMLIDDHGFRAIVRGMPWMPTSKWDLYVLSDGDQQTMLRFIENGPYTWWTLPGFKIHFFRPLSSLMLWIDLDWLGDRAVLTHVHSIAWWLLALGGAIAVFRRVLPARIAALAMLFFAFDDAHFIPVAWLANRHVLVSGAAMLWGFWAWLRWRQEGARWGLPLAVLLFLAGLAGGESALTMFAVVAAWELWGRAAPLRSRVVAVAGLGAIALGYLVAYRAHGFGAFGSSIYVDPGAHPALFLKLAPARLLGLMAPLTLNIPSDGFLLATEVAVIVGSAGALGVAVWVFAFRKLWSSLDAERRAALRWMVPASVLSLVPGLATFPSDRMLFAASLGGAAALAMLLDAAFTAGGGWKRFALGLGALHVLIPLGVWTVEPRLLRKIDDAYLSSALDTGVAPEALRGRVLYVNAPDLLAGVYAPLFRYNAGHGSWRSWNVLSAAPLDHRLTRTGERAFTLEPIGGRILASGVEGLFRNPKLQPFTVGESARIGAGTVRVTAIEDGLPTAISIELEEPLEAYTLVQWKDRRLTVLIPPAVGESVVLQHELSPGERLLRGG